MRSILKPLLLAAILACSTAADVAQHPLKLRARGQKSASITCGLLLNAAFCDTFDTPSATRGRAGDLDPSRWAVARLTPSNLLHGINFIRQSPIPTCRSGVSAADHYPPDDSLICDGTSSFPGKLLTAVTIQEYGNHAYMIRQPFDFASRTGKIVMDVDMVSEGALATYIEIDITEDPHPAPTFHIVQNNEAGPLAKNGVFISFDDIATGHTSVGTVHTYSDYAKSEITASSSQTGVSGPTVAAGSLNHIEVQISASHLAIYASDAGGSNFRKIWEADITLGFTRGYVHIGARNHATVKYGYDWGRVYYWDTVGFDGPVIATPRAYEIPDNTTTGHDSSPPVGPAYDFMRLGYEVSDGSVKAEGVYDKSTADGGATLVSPLTFAGSVNLTGMSSATLTLNLFVNAISSTPDTTWGIKYRLNGGTWRTRLLTSAEVATLTPEQGSGGNVAIVISVPFGDVASGTNTIDFSSVGAPMNFPPQICNIDLLLAA